MKKKHTGVLELRESRWTADEINTWVPTQNWWVAWEKVDGVLVGQIFRKKGGLPFGDFFETAPNSGIYNYRLYLD